MKKSDINCIILCGGKGSRMNSDKTHKVCFEIAGIPAIKRLMKNLTQAGIEKFTVVVGSMAGKVIECIGEDYADIQYVYQKEALGTGDAVLIAVNVYKRLGICGPIMIVMGDKIIDAGVIENLIERFDSSNADAIVAVQPREFNTSGGRIVMDSSGRIRGICEEIDIKRALIYKAIFGRKLTEPRLNVPISAQYVEEISRELVPSDRNRQMILSNIIPRLADSERFINEAEEKQFIKLGNDRFDPEYIESTKLVNTATYLFNQDALYYALERLTSDNTQNEVYLTEAFNILANSVANNRIQFNVCALSVREKNHIMSFNTVDELLEIEHYFTSMCQSIKNDVSPDMLKPVGEWARLFEQMPAEMRDCFSEIYGDEGSDIEEKRRMYLDVLDYFKKKFGENRQVIISRAPGRINLMGRHVEHRGGNVNVISINREVIAVVSPREDDLIRITNVDSRFADREFLISDYLTALAWDDWMSCIESEEIRNMVKDSRGDWINYVKAAVLKLQHTFKNRKLKGMDMAFSGNIPMAAGLSSSSAIVVAVAEAVVAINNLDISVQKFVDLCGEGEWFVGSRGGAGDHAAMKFGSRGYIAHLGFFPFGFKKAIKFPDGYKLIIADSHVKAQKTTNAKDLFNQRVASYEFGLMLIKEKFPQYAHLMERLRDINPENLGISPSRIYEILLKIPEKVRPTELFELLPVKYHKRIRDIMNSHTAPDFYLIRSVVLFGIAECRRSKICCDLLEEGDFDTFGKLMEISHNGDRVAVFKDGQKTDYDWSTSDAYLNRLIEDLKSEDPKRVLQAQLEMQPGGYACSIPEIDYMVDLTKKVPGVIGAQLSGAGLGGCIMILVREEAVDDLISVLNKEYYQPMDLDPGTLVCVPVKGSLIWKCPSITFLFEYFPISQYKKGGMYNEDKGRIYAS